MKAIKKLQEHNIFKKDSIVESVITKDWMGSPVDKKVHLIVREELFLAWLWAKILIK